jgi:hypothetical protein
MKYAYFLTVIVGLMSCHSTKKSSDSNSVLNSDLVEEGTGLQFECYYDSDTLEHLILYFPEEKKFFINSEVGNKEDLCQIIKKDIDKNKGVKHFYEPKSNFMYMISVVRAVEKCYKDKIDELSIENYGLTYEELNSDQKAEIDARLSYRVVGE